MDHERWRCAEVFCAKTTFAEATLEAPPRARGTTRLKTAISRAVAGEVRSVDRVATQFGVSWATVQRQINTAADVVAHTRPNRPRLVTEPGIDEHRFRAVRWFRSETGGWTRVEPWIDDPCGSGDRGGHRRR